MRKTLLAVAASAALLGMSSTALAVDIGGLNVPLGPTFAVTQVYENIVTGVGATLTGYGKVDSINSAAVGTLCADCELTYQFGGYVVSSISPTKITFTGGWVKFYLGFGVDNDFNPFTSGSSAADLIAATNGSLWMTLKGHDIDAAGNTFAGTGTDIGTTTPSGSGSGLADVDTSGGGAANPFFDTNAVPALFGGGPADFVLTSSFSGLFPPHPGECPAGASCVTGSADFRGSVTAIPEPEAYALMLAGLAVVLFVSRRRND